MESKRTIAPGAVLLVALLLIPVSGCRTRAIHNPEGRLPRASLEVRARQIERAAQMQGWRTETLAPGVILATLRRRQHGASTTIQFDESSYSIELRNSVALGQSEGKIHRAYNAWVRALDDSIRREAAADHMIHVASPPPADGR